MKATHYILYAVLGVLSLPGHLHAQLAPFATDSLAQVVEGFGHAGGILYYSNNTSTHGDELWKTDGTAAGCQLVKDIDPGTHSVGGYPLSSFPRQFTTVQNMVFFKADFQGNTRLWKSDGTTTGTLQMHPTMLPGDVFVSKNNKLFFIGDDGIHGEELWVSDGTTAGTFMLKDIFTGSTGASIYELFVDGNYIYFSANDNIHGRELWRSDGTTAGTSLLLDIVPGPANSGVARFQKLNNKLVFIVYTPATGTELGLYSIPNNSLQIVDIRPGIDPWGNPNSSNLQGLTQASNLVYFSADDSVHGFELWKTDGTVAGTMMIKDILPGTGHGFPSKMAAVNNKLLFSANGGPTVGIELWTSDGTSANTLMVKDLIPGPNSSSIVEPFIVAGGNLVFQLYGQANLWQSDGTTAGTFAFTNMGLPPWSWHNHLLRHAVVNDTVYFATVYGNPTRGGIFKYGPFQSVLSASIEKLSAARQAQGEVRLSWPKPTNIAPVKQEIWRKTEHEDFWFIGDLGQNSQSGHDGMLHFIDENAPLRRAVYRIRMIDANGQPHWSNIAEVEADPSGPVAAVFPNPFSNAFKINTNQVEPLHCKLYDLKGSLIFSQIINPSDPISPSGLRPGKYWYKISDQTGKVLSNGSLIKQ